MKNSVLEELVRRWHSDAKEPEFIDGSNNALVSNAVAKGERQAKRECADTILRLIEILGER
jgi:hypothetical protein